MKFTEEVFIKLETNNKELGRNSDLYWDRNIYYRDKIGFWYYKDVNNDLISIINNSSIHIILENLYKEMWPFKEQMELF